MIRLTIKIVDVEFLYYLYFYFYHSFSPSHIIMQASTSASPNSTLASYSMRMIQ